MPSLNRPNAPDRLPSSDFGNLFGRPRAVRGSDLTSANSTPSPLTTPNNYIAAQRRALRSSEGANAAPVPTSPLASPPLAVVRQRPKQAERRSYYSDPSASAVSPPHELFNIPSLSSEVPLIVEEEEPTPLKNRTASDSSSVSSRARRLLRLPGICITPGTGPGDEQPPSKARSGFKWKREFSGRWLEIRIGRKGQSAEHSAQGSEEATPLPLSHRSTMHLPPLSQTSTIAGPEARDRSSHAASDQRLIPESRDDALQSTTLAPKEGLYCRTKRALGLKHDPVIPRDVEEPRQRTSTDTLLDRVSSTLRFLPNRKTTTTTTTATTLSANSTTTSTSNLSIAAAPRWQRILNNHSPHGTNNKANPAHGHGLPSTSSSIREMMMGKPPLHTPEPEALYTASDSHRYMAVDLTAPNGTAFLPSEARRIHTPPLPPDTATTPGGGGKARGFFFDYTAPPSTTTSFPEPPHAKPASVQPTAAPTTSSSSVGHERSPPPDWYRVQLHTVDSGAESDVSRYDFALTIPEHLPNSPLCPRHPKYRASGGGGGAGRGGGECPFHGRNQVGGGLSARTSPGEAVGEHWW